MRIALLVLFGLHLQAASLRAGDFHGRVYLDANGNGSMDPSEQGIPNVAVSDGSGVVTTGADGKYRIGHSKAARALLRVTVPRDRAAPGGFWHWSDGDSGTDFGLVARPQPDDFVFVQVTDSHVGRNDLMREFFGRLNRLPIPIAFVIHTGDIGSGLDGTPPDKVGDQFRGYLEAAFALKWPLFHVLGNHDHVGTSAPTAGSSSHPRFGRGFFEETFGPAYYSFDWGGIHFVALDGTAVSGDSKEAMGDDQRSWLRADLAIQPAAKPLVLFCHQSIPELSDAQELAALVKGRNVLAAFCGHLHKTFTVPFAGFPVYHTGAFCGSWWKGPNPDGTPRGYRLIQVQSGALRTAYTSAEGTYPLYVSKPSSESIQSGRIGIEAVVVDFGKPVEAAARYAGHRVPLHLASREPLWSTWMGTVDTAAAPDGDRPLKVSSQLVNEMSWSQIRYLAINGQEEPYQAESPAVLKIQAFDIDAVDEVLLGGCPLAALSPAKEATVQIAIPAEDLKKINRVTIRATAGKGDGRDDFQVGRVWLEYQGQAIYDLRYSFYDRHKIGGGAQADVKPERDWYFCLP